MHINDLTPELREKAVACKTPEELIALAKDEGMELTDDQLDAIAGGAWNCWTDCDEVTYGSNSGGCPGVFGM